MYSSSDINILNTSSRNSYFEIIFREFLISGGITFHNLAPTDLENDLFTLILKFVYMIPMIPRAKLYMTLFKTDQSGD